MTNHDERRHLEIKDETDRTVAQAEVTTALGPEGTVRTSMQSDPYAPPGTRASLVDAVMDLPEVQASDRVEAAVPYGDAESLERLRERTEDRPRPGRRAPPPCSSANVPNVPDSVQPPGPESGGEPPSLALVGAQPGWRAGSGTAGAAGQRRSAGRCPCPPAGR